MIGRCLSIYVPAAAITVWAVAAAAWHDAPGRLIIALELGLIPIPALCVLAALTPAFNADRFEPARRQIMIFVVSALAFLTVITLCAVWSFSI